MYEFISRSLGIEQGFMQCQENLPELRQLLPRLFETSVGCLHQTSGYRATPARTWCHKIGLVKKSWIVPVGGFLGAGKTTLVIAAARHLQQQGLKPAAILNDQGADLVDTAYTRASGLPASEVTGGCFCCRFSDFLAAADQLRSYAPDVIFAEPVGSCTDLSATILQPLKSGSLGQYRLAPLTVLVDPTRAADIG